MFKSLRYIKIIFLVMLGIIAIKIFGNKNIMEIINYNKNIITNKTIFVNKGFKGMEFENCKIYFKEKDRKYVSSIKSSIDFYMPYMKKDFGIDKLPKVRIIVYPDENSMSESMGIELKQIPVGAYYSGIINVLSPDVWASGEDYQKIETLIEQGPIVHELAHYLLDYKTHGNFEVWFSEGVAIYCEEKYMGITPKLIESKNIISYKKLRKDFEILTNEQAYEQSYYIINSYVLGKGEESLESVINKLSQGENLENIFKGMGYSL